MLELLLAGKGAEGTVWMVGVCPLTTGDAPLEVG